MSSGSFTSAGIDSKRQRALPVPRAIADMKTFTPDSSIASDVIPSANYGERNNGPAARHDRAALHRHARRRRRDRAALHRGHRRLGALHRAGGRPHRAMRAGEQARLARRRVLLGRRGRHQFLLDRDRDHQSRPRLGLPGFPAAPDRRRDRAVPRHHAPPQGALASRARRIPTSRRRARRIRARNSRGIRWPIPASATGCSRRRSCAARRSSSAASATTSPACRPRWPATATTSRPTASMTAPPWKSSPRSSATSAPRASTASPIIRP